LSKREATTYNWGFVFWPRQMNHSSFQARQPN